MKKTNKKNQTMDRVMTFVLIAFAVIIVVAIGSSFFDSKDDGEEQKENTTTTAAVTEEPKVDEKYITRYGCVISEGNEDATSGSAFYLELNENDGTFKKFLSAGKEKSELNQGKFTRKDGYIETVDKNGLISKLYSEGEYLITDTAVYDGKIPDTKTFKKKLISEATGENKVEMKFEKNGKFTQQIIRFGAKLDGGDTSDITEGTYKRKGKFIERTKSDGSKMMPLYLYKDQICTSYYKLEKTGNKE